MRAVRVWAFLAAVVACVAPLRYRVRSDGARTSVVLTTLPSNMCFQVSKHQHVANINNTRKAMTTRFADWCQKVKFGGFCF